MEIRIGKWGNSLALRIPSKIARGLKIRRGDTVHAEVTPDGALVIRRAAWNRKTFADELRRAHAEMPMGYSVIEELRRNARY